MRLRSRLQTAGLQTRSKEMHLYIFLSIVQNDFISVVPEIVDEMISQYILNYSRTKTGINLVISLPSSSYQHFLFLRQKNTKNSKQKDQLFRIIGER